MSHTYKTTLAPQTLETAAPRAKAVLEQAKAKLGFIPNMYTGMVNSPGLLETYCSATSSSAANRLSARWSRRSYFSRSAAKMAAPIVSPRTA